VKFPTGGKAREPFGRPGVIPGPTVKHMKENNNSKMPWIFCIYKIVWQT